MSQSSRLVQATAVLAVTALCSLVPAHAEGPNQDKDGVRLHPGNLVVSRSVYDNDPANIKVGTVLPPGCAATQGGCAGPGGAINDGTYPYVFNNAAYDGSFGITSRIYLDQITPEGRWVGSLEVPNSLERGITPQRDQMVTSFPSKSELALHLSTDRRHLSFMGYRAPVNAIDVSNSNTPGAVDATNPVGESYYRVVADINERGQIHFTETNAYSGNNGRAAILNNTTGDLFYTAGNAGNGANPQPAGVVLGAGAQFIDRLRLPEVAQDPGTPTPLASFNVTQLGDKADKLGKDDNFRGITVHDGVVHYTKGSGGNGVNTVYFVDTTGTACPTGVGLPVQGAALPTSPLVYDPATLATTGLPSNMCILAGFPTTLAKKATAFPFALWFADAKTLYVTDEGDGYAGGADLYTHAAAQTTAGLQKWVFDSTSKTWKLAYTLQTGLQLGAPYTVPGYPTASNTATNLPWSPATAGLRNLEGTVEHGHVTLWAITSTVSGSGDQGADPNRLVRIDDDLENTDATVALSERFQTVKQAGFAEVLRGVSFTPGTGVDDRD